MLSLNSVVTSLVARISFIPTPNVITSRTTLHEVQRALCSCHSSSSGRGRGRGSRGSRDSSSRGISSVRGGMGGHEIAAGDRSNSSNSSINTNNTNTNPSTNSKEQHH